MQVNHSNEIMKTPKLFVVQKKKISYRTLHVLYHWHLPLLNNLARLGGFVLIL